MRQRLPIDTTGSVASAVGAMCGRNGGTVAHDRLGPNVDQVLVVDGALREQQAGPGPHSLPKQHPRIVRAHGPARPRRVHQPGKGTPQRRGGPSSRRMVGGGADPSAHGGPPVDHGGRGYTWCVPPLPRRMVAPGPLHRRAGAHRPPPTPAPALRHSARPGSPSTSARHSPRSTPRGSTGEGPRREGSRGDGYEAGQRRRRANSSLLAGPRTPSKARSTGSATTSSPTTHSRASPAR